MREVRVFISSPDDAMAERGRIERVIDRLNGVMGDTGRMRAIRWESSFYTADRTFQDQIPEAADCDVVIGILRHRLGTELPDDFRRMPDGQPYPSGTAYEILSAVEARRQGERPDVYVFRYARPPGTDNIDDEEGEREVKDQWRRLKAFFERWFLSADGRFQAAFQTYSDVPELERQADTLLRAWIAEHLTSGHMIEWPIALKGSPFVGLAAFGYKHAPVFFGRQTETLQAVDGLRDAAERGMPSLFLFGSSGSGKSSLARAGIIPQLVAPGSVPSVDLWRVVSVRPGEHADGPLAALAAQLFRSADDLADLEPEEEGRPPALPELARGDYPTPAALARLLERADDSAIRPILTALDRVSEDAWKTEESGTAPTARLILLVDQCEELFAAGVSPAERAAFGAVLRALVESRRVWLVATLRADYYEALIVERDLLVLKRAGAELDLHPPRPESMAEIIRAPARAAGLVFETDAEGRALDQLILTEADRPDMLPMVEFALNRLYENRVERDGVVHLTHAAYRAFGGLDGAIDQKADGALAALGKAERRALPRLLRQLVAPARESGQSAEQPHRMALRSVSWAEIGGDPALHRLADALIDARILLLSGKAPQARIRLAHQRVLESWALARRVVAENADFYRILQEVEDAQIRWRQGKKRSDRLIQPGVALAEAESLLARFPDEVKAAQDFIRASGHRARRRQRLTTAAAALFAGIAAFAGWQYISAERAHEAAETERRKAIDNFRFSLDSVDELALDIVKELQVNWAVPVDEKRLVTGQLESKLKTLFSNLEDDAPEFRRRYADLLASTALMLYRIGLHLEGREWAACAVALLDAPDAAPPPAPGTARAATLTRARAEIALAWGEWQAFQSDSATRHLNAAAARLDRLGVHIASPVDADRTVLRAWIDEVRVSLLLDRQSDLNTYGTQVEQATDRLRRDLDRLAAAGETRAARLVAVSLTNISQKHTAFSVAMGFKGLEQTQAEARRDLDRARAVFGRAQAPLVEALEARQTINRGRILAERQEYGAAVKQATDAIMRLTPVIAQSGRNVAWLEALSSALEWRARWAWADGNPIQAARDIGTARGLARLIVREGGLSRVGFQAASWVDTLEAQRLAADGRDPQATLARILARIDVLRARGLQDPALGTQAFNARYFLARTLYRRVTRASSAGQEGQRDPSSLLRALDLTREALDELGQEAHPGTGGIVPASNRYHVYYLMTEIANTLRDAPLWRRSINNAIAQSSRLIRMTDDGPRWLENRARLVSGLGEDQRRGGAPHKAAENFEMAARDTLAALRNGSASLPNLVDLFARTRVAIDALGRAGEWQAGASLFRDVLDFVRGQDGLSGRGAGVQSGWRTVVGALESAAPTEEDMARLTADLPMPLPAVADHLEHMVRFAARRDERTLAARRDLRELDLPPPDPEWGFSPVDSGLPPTRMPGAWRTLAGPDAEQEWAPIVLAINEARDWDGRIAASVTRNRLMRVRELDLPFYRNIGLVEADFSLPDGRFLTVTVLKTIVRRILNGTHTPLLIPNRTHLRLDSGEAAAAYLHFHIGYASRVGTGAGGDAYGVARIVERVSDLPWDATADPALKARVGERLRPLAVWQDPDRPGRWLATASVLRGNRVHHEALVLDPDGTVEITGSRRLGLEELPLLHIRMTHAGVVSTHRIHVVDLAPLGVDPDGTDAMIACDPEAPEGATHPPDADTLIAVDRAWADRMRRAGLIGQEAYDRAADRAQAVQACLSADPRPRCEGLGIPVFAGIAPDPADPRSPALAPAPAPSDDESGIPAPQTLQGSELGLQKVHGAGIHIMEPS
jgi:hypothetical protein